MAKRNAELTRTWEAITPAHEQVIADYRESFSTLSSGEQPDPLAVVGAYGSGKTQLLYQIFNEAWENNIGAVYIGDPGKLLDEFDNSDTIQIESWLENRIHEEIEHFVNRDTENISWFPNTTLEHKQEWLDTYVTVDDPDDVTKYAVLVDEVEQHYEDFLAAVETDDDNPLRVINDEVPDTLKVWSFGMLSAYEFLGEADWRRLKELRVPPLDVNEVANRLSEEDPSIEPLANIIWWMGRGRTGLIIKLIDELPSDIESNVAAWIQNMADSESQGTPVIEDIWADLDPSAWDAACETLAFKPSYDDWTTSAQKGYSSETMTNVVSNLIFDTSNFSATDQGRTAKRILKRNINRVFDGATPTQTKRFPAQALRMDGDECAALLSLIEDQIITFEPKGPARRRAIEALEVEEIDFRTKLFEAMDSVEPDEGDFHTTAFKQLDAAFQPIALNPDLVADTPTGELRDNIDSPLQFVADAAHDNMDVYFCPTEDVLQQQLQRTTNEYDITKPTVLITPKELAEQVNNSYSTFEDLDLLSVVSHESSMLWDFVLNLQGALSEQDMDPAQPIDDKTRQKLLESVSNRDARNTIDTLYDQLSRVGVEEAKTATKRYVERYSLPTESTVLWESQRLQADTPYWTSGKSQEIVRTQAYMITLCDPPVFSRPYGKLHSSVRTAIDEEFVSGGPSFPYTEFLKELYSENELAQKVHTERSHYIVNGHLASGVQNTRDALFKLAKEFDLEDTAESLDEFDNAAGDGDITVLDIDLSMNALALLRALLMNKIASDTPEAFGMETELETVENNLRTYRTNFEEQVDTIETYNSILQTPDCASVGSWPTVDASTCQGHAHQLESLEKGVNDLKERSRVNSGIAPYAWAYLLMLRLFTDQVSETVDRYETKVNSTSLNNVQLLKEIYCDLYSSIESSDALQEHAASESELRANLESIGDEIFQFSDTDNIPLPSHNDLLQTIETDAQELVPATEDLRELVDDIEAAHDQINADAEELRELLESLLDQAVAESEAVA